MVNIFLNQRRVHASLTEVITILEAALAFCRYGASIDVVRSCARPDAASLDTTYY